MNKPMHQLLREATHAAHESLDSMFGSLNLASEAGYRWFLSAHFIGTRALQAPFADFVSRELRLDPPDFPSMLAADLADLGLSPERLPGIAPETKLDPAGITYVISGSRLGLAMIRKQPYWGKHADTANRYMEDASGLAVWRALLAWMNARAPEPGDADAASASARYAFDVFRRAFALSGESRSTIGLP